MSPNKEDIEGEYVQGSAPVSEELKTMVKNGDESLPSNANSLGFGIQQIKLDYWKPENEEYWEVS